MRRFGLERLRTLTLLAGAAVAVTSCGGDAVVVPPAGPPAIASVLLRVAFQPVGIDATGRVTGGPIVLRAGVSADLTAEFLDSNGLPKPGVTPSDYELRIEPAYNAPVQFKQSVTDGFAGSLVCVYPNVQATLYLTAYNTKTKHVDFGPVPVPVLVSN